MGDASAPPQPAPCTRSLTSFHSIALLTGVGVVVGATVFGCARLRTEADGLAPAVPEAPAVSAGPVQPAQAAQAASSAQLPDARPKPAIEAGRFVPGFPHAVDPVAVITVVRKAAGLDDSWLLERMDARFVNPAGTVDLDPRGYATEIDYTFQTIDPTPPQHPSVPVGARDVSVHGRMCHVELDVHGIAKGGVTSTSHFGAPADELRASLGVAMPHCSTAAIWRAATRN
jgi:hypothetical protein